WRRDAATYEAMKYANRAFRQPRWRSMTVAVANVIVAWPEGNDRWSLPLGRSRWVASLIGLNRISPRICAYSRSMPRSETLGSSLNRPHAYTAMAPAICSGVLPMYFPGAKNVFHSV